jgi:hypothetical protein
MSSGVFLVSLGAAGLMLCFAGLFLTIVAVGLWNWSRSRRWPEAPGQVLSSEVGWVSNGRSRARKAFVTYRYQVGGQAYQANRVTFWGTRAADPDELVSHYPAGLPTQVRYNPSSPSDAVLQRTMPNIPLYLGLAALMVALAGMTVGLYFLLTTFIL